jgi:hypothetical protein
MAAPTQLVKDVDYYLEGEKLVFTAAYHLKRGYCCNSKCRHCPYGLAPGGEKPQVVRIDIAGLPGLLKPKGAP